MTFHLAVMQYTGAISDRGPHSRARVRRNDVGRRLVTGFELMLAEHLPQPLTGAVQVGFPLCAGKRGRVEWRWPDVFSASAVFFLGDQVKFTWFYFAGHDPVADDIVLRFTADFIKDRAAGTGVELRPEEGLRSLPERPLAVCVPWPPNPSEHDRRLVGNVAVCLAAAFFQKADETFRRGRAVWEAYQRWVRTRSLDGADN